MLSFSPPQALVPALASVSDRLLDGIETALVQVLASEDEQRAMLALEVRGVIQESLL